MTRHGMISTGRVLLAYTFLGCMLLLLANCGGGSGTSGSGNSLPTTLNISISDPPTCAGPSGPFAHVYVTIIDVKIHASSTAGPNDPGWVDLTPSLASSPKQVDLLAQANNQCFLATLGSTSALQPGSYQQIRIYLADNSVSVPSNACGTSANCVMLTTDPDAPLPLDVSGESQAGIKIPSGQIAGGQFSIAGGETKDLNIDFDACASIVQQGNGRYRLKPVLHAGEVSLTSTSINGRVVDSTSGQAIAGGVTVVALEQKDSSGVDRVIMETVADSTGAFVFCPVPAGTYDVVAAAVNGSATAYGATIITGVQSGNALGTVPLVAEGGANAGPGSITGLITTSSGSATSADVVLSALQSVEINDSNVLVTVPLAQQSTATLTVTTVADGTCPANTDCVTYTLAVPALNPSAGAFSTSGNQQPAAPAAGPVSYTVDGQAVLPNSGGTPDCSPSDQRTNSAATGGHLIVTAGGSVSAETLAFSACQ